MISINEYKLNPCRAAAIPYWKLRTYKVPNNISVIHDEDYSSEAYTEAVDTQYFRLKHKLQSVKPFTLDKSFEYRKVNINSINDLKQVVDIINKCYEHILVDLEQVTSWTKAEVFHEDLWVFIIDGSSGKPAALGIAELDGEVREGMLEWIQVLPEYQKRKLGQAIINNLLINFIDKADFVTVSGEVDNKTNPERVYRKCGFEGDDIWHVLRRE